MAALRIHQVFLPFRWDLTGFALARAFSSAMLAGAAGPLGAHLGSAALQVVLYLCSSAAATALVVSSPLAGRGAEPSSNAAPAVMGAAGFAGAAAVAFGLAGGSGDLVGAGCILAGLAGGYFESAWGSRFVSLDRTGIQVYTLLMTAVAAILGTLLSLADPVALFALSSLLPLASAALFIRGPIEAEQGDPEQDLDCARRRGSALTNILLSVLAFSAIYNLVVVLSYDYLPTAAASQIRFVANLVTALVLLALSAFLKPVKTVAMFRLVLPVTAVGFVLYLGFPSSLGFIALAVSGMGRKLFDILTWVVVAQAVREYAWNANRCFGFLIAAKNMGYLLGLLLANTALDYGSGAVGVGMAVPVLLLVLVVMFFWLFPEGTIDQLFNPVEARPLPEPARASIEERAAAVARLFGLTPRETEVLGLLARGRTQAVIAEKMGVSAGTVHTHIVHVYQKLGIGKQQELIEMVETFEPESDDTTPKAP